MKKLNPYKLPLKDISLPTLMSRPRIEGMPKLRLSREQCLTVCVADRLREHTIKRKLRCVWMHIPNEGKRSQYDGAVTKAMGRIPGAPDFIFLGFGVIELKTDDGKQREAQEMFEWWCGEEKIEYVICRSVEEVENQLRVWGALGAGA